MISVDAIIAVFMVLICGVRDSHDMTAVARMEMSLAQQRSLHSRWQQFLAGSHQQQQPLASIAMFAQPPFSMKI